jgi:hypothetical protein
MGIGVPGGPKIGVPDLSSALKNPLDLLGGGSSSASSADKPILKEVPTAALSRKIQTIKPDNWNKSMPYYFAIVEANEDGSVSSHGLSASIMQALGLNSNIVPLWISPSSLSISTQYAMSVSATNGGILEEANGVVFRMISLQGSFGVLPNKTNRNEKSTAKPAVKLIQNLFPGATTAIKSLINQAQSVAKAVTGGKDGDLDKINAKLNLNDTGYFRIWTLHNFLVAYAEGKKNPIFGSSLRLIFGSGKDNIAYVVTPTGAFDIKRDSSNPLLGRYAISLKAWDITTVNPAIKFPEAEILTPDAQNAIKAAVDVLRQSRATVYAARNVLSGVHSDLINILDIYNQGLLFVSDVGGLAADVLTFFPTLSSNANSLLLNSERNRKSMLEALNKPEERSVGQQVPKSLSVTVPSTSASASTKESLASAGLDSSEVGLSTNVNGQSKQDSAKVSVPTDSSSLAKKAMATESFQGLSLNDLDLPPSVQAEIDLQTENALSLTAGDVRELTEKLQEVSDNFASSIGAMDSDYARTYGIPDGNSSRVPTEDDIIIAAALQDSKSTFTATLATGQIFQERDVDPFLSANRSIPSDEQLITPLSSIAVPFERGATLERLAQRYLGDPRRAREIAIVNDLRVPYIDEEGFFQSIAGANGRTFVVITADRLAIGQAIVISGTGLTSTRRRIVNLQNIGGEEFRVTVDGPANLELYIPGSNPRLFTHLPGTVAPGDMILIPSGVAPEELAAIRPTPLYNRLDHAEKTFRIDLALDSDGRDLAVSASGDAQRSYGYDNAIQALRLQLETERGELPRHPTYGLPVPIGARFTEVDLPKIPELIRASVVSDPRFSGAEVQVEIDGTAVYVSVAAEGASGTGQIPVTFEIGKE